MVYTSEVDVEQQPTSVRKDWTSEADDKECTAKRDCCYNKSTRRSARTLLQIFSNDLKLTNYQCALYTSAGDSIRTAGRWVLFSKKVARRLFTAAADVNDRFCCAGSPQSQTD